ncbi:MAG: hypothetical protein WCI77_00820 [Candidatus Omnitrophota bacterium]
MVENKDELLDSQECTRCGSVVYLGHDIEWIDKEKKIAKCPQCGEKIKAEKR